MLQTVKIRLGMVTLASCGMAALRAPERGAKHRRNLTPGGHLDSARTGHFYLALILTGRRRCGYVKPPVPLHRRNEAKRLPNPRLALQSGGQVTLDYVSPSKVANACLWLATGQTVEGTLDRMSQRVKAIVKRSVDQLDRRIAQHSDEGDAVYPPGGSTIGRYVTFPPLHILLPRRAR